MNVVKLLNRLLRQPQRAGLWLVAIQVLILLVIAGTALRAQAAPDRVSQRVWGYVAWWMKDEWKSMTLAHFERLVFIQVKVGPDGMLQDRHGWPENWVDLQQSAQRHKVPLDVALTVFDAPTFNGVFGSPEATQRLMNEALKLVQADGLAGLHLDVEVNQDLDVQAVNGFRGFVAELGQRLRRWSPRKQISVFLPFGDYLRIYDAATLGHVDRVVLQGYDAHYLDSPVAGPVSPLEGMDTVNWAKMLAAADALKVARSKMIMGFPLYGYEWTVPSCMPRGDHQGKGEVTTLLPARPDLNLGIAHNAQERVAKYGARVEPVSNSLYYLFVGDSGMCTVGWFEDWWSLQVKADWIVKQNLGGIAFFPLGYDRGVLVETLLSRWRATPTSPSRP